MTEPTDLLSAFSDRLTALVSRAAPHVVRVEGRRRGASGVAWSADGVVVTSHHALERDDEVEVGLPPGGSAVADVVGRDPTSDVAVLRVRSGALAPVEWAEASDLAAGALVVSVARPGRTPRAGLGIVARAAEAWRAPAGGKVDRYLETTLDLHRGLSGALVLSAAGAPIGVATAGLLRGTAMILPAATLRRVVKSLLAHGEIRRGYLGLATIPVPLDAALRERTGEEVALLVTRVEPDSPAHRAGLALGDAILSFGGEALQDPGELLAFLSEDRIGDALPLRLLRGGEVSEVTVTVGARGRP